MWHLPAQPMTPTGSRPLTNSDRYLRPRPMCREPLDGQLFSANHARGGGRSSESAPSPRIGSAIRVVHTEHISGTKVPGASKTRRLGCLHALIATAAAVVESECMAEFVNSRVLQVVLG